MGYRRVSWWGGPGPMSGYVRIWMSRRSPKRGLGRAPEGPRKGSRTEGGAKATGTNEVPKVL